VAVFSKDLDGLTISLKDIRTDLKMSQEVMAQKIGVSQQKLSMVENGTAKLKPNEQRRLQKMLPKFPGLIYDPCERLDEWFTMQGKRKAGQHEDESTYHKVLAALGIDNVFLERYNKKGGYFGGRADLA
jgi:DNA-binding XRE family transcriptional regulator